MSQHRFMIVAGSHRRDSQSGRIARYIAGLVGNSLDNVETDILDLGQTELPLWREDFWANPRQGWETWDAIVPRLRSATGLVIITPEWSGMVPAGLKNFFLLCSPRELADKPGLIVAVSSGMGGAYPVAELRMSSYKNTFLCYLPNQIILRNVTALFQDEAAPSPLDEELRARLLHDLKLLRGYATALAAVREQKLRDLDSYPHGV